LKHDFQFKINKEKIDNNRVSLEDTEFYHCTQVLRKKTGEEIKLFDGLGNSYIARIKKILKNHAELEILNSARFIENLPDIFLGIGAIKTKALEIVLSQVSSLGVSHFCPINTDSSIKKRFNLEKYSKRALESIKQCGAAKIPQIHQVMDIEDWFHLTKNCHLKLIALQDNSYSISELENKILDRIQIAVMIGPEAGFSNNEIKSAKESGFIPVNISNRRLRSELAATSLISNILYIHSKKRIENE